MTLLPLLLALTLGADAPHMAMLPLKGVNLSPELLGYCGSQLGEKLVGRGFIVTSEADLVALLGLERQRTLLGCAEDGSSCLAEMSQALGAERIVLGNVAKLGNRFQFDARVLNSSDGKRLATATASASSEEAIPEALDRLAAQLAEQLKVPLPVAPSAPQGPGLGLRFWLPELGGVALALGGGALLVVAQLQYTQLVTPGAALSSAEYTPKINALLTEPVMIERIHALGSDPKGGTPDEFKALIARDIARWTKVIADAGIERI